MRMMRVLLIGIISAMLVSGLALADESPWRPERNSPVNPAQIMVDRDANGVAPDQPWLVGYPYDKVPEQSNSGQ